MPGTRHLAAPGQNTAAPVHNTCAAMSRSPRSGLCPGFGGTSARYEVPGGASERAVRSAGESLS
jgi:hypothetical protein